MDVRLESLFPPPVLHPGVLLRQEFLDRYEIPQAELAQAIGVGPANLCTVIHGRRHVSVEMGRLLAAALGTLPEYWLLRQLAWDLEHAEPLRPVVRMPQLPKPAINGTGSGLRRRRRHGASNGRRQRELSRSQLAQDRRF